MKEAHVSLCLPVLGGTWESSWSDGVISDLICPICGEFYNHLKFQGEVDGEDSYKAGWGGRGDLLILEFVGECGHLWQLLFGFHKGYMAVLVRYVDSDLCFWSMKELEPYDETCPNCTSLEDLPYERRKRHVWRDKETKEYFYAAPPSFEGEEIRDLPWAGYVGRVCLDCLENRVNQTIQNDEEPLF